MCIDGTLNYQLHVGLYNQIITYKKESIQVQILQKYEKPLARPAQS